MAELPKPKHTTGAKVLEWRARATQEHREHLGASLIGHNCDRHLWLTFRWVTRPNFDGRILRLFDRGKREEAVVFDELRGIGVELFVEEAGKQLDCRDSTGHFGGSVDGIGKGFPEAPNQWAVLEIKTHSAKSFVDLKKKGVEESQPKHFTQMQVYMGFFKLDRALYYAVNKDSDELYTEWVHFDEDCFRAAVARAQRIIEQTAAPARISDDPAFFVCKMCNFHAICHQKKMPEVNCRTCCHSTPIENGQWRCERHAKGLNASDQRAGCGEHLFNPSLIPATVVDATEGNVTYQDPDTGKQFINGPDGFGSEEIAACTMEALTDETVQTLRKHFKGSKLESVTMSGEDFNDPIPF